MSVGVFIAFLDLLDGDDLHGPVEFEEHPPITHPQPIAAGMIFEPLDVRTVREVRQALRLLVDAPGCLIVLDFSQLPECLLCPSDGVHVVFIR